MTNRIFTGKRTGELINILVTENTPEAITGIKLRSKRGRCFEEEANIGEFVFEAREKGGKGLFVLRKIFVAKTLVVIYFADLTELKLAFLLLPCACFRLGTPALALRSVPHYQRILFRLPWNFSLFLGADDQLRAAAFCDQLLIFTASRVQLVSK